MSRLEKSKQKVGHDRRRESDDDQTVDGGGAASTEGTNGAVLQLVERAIAAAKAAKVSRGRVGTKIGDAALSGPQSEITNPTPTEGRPYLSANASIPLPEPPAPTPESPEAGASANAGSIEQPAVADGPVTGEPMPNEPDSDVIVGAGCGAIPAGDSDIDPYGLLFSASPQPTSETESSLTGECPPIEINDAGPQGAVKSGAGSTKKPRSSPSRSRSKSRSRQRESSSALPDAPVAYARGNRKSPEPEATAGSLSDGLARWEAESAAEGPSKSVLSLARLERNQRLFIPFTTAMETVAIHYLGIDGIQYVRCNRPGCLLCDLDNERTLRDLLPVYDPLEKAVVVLAVSENRRQQALRPALHKCLLALRDRDERIVVGIRRLDMARFEVAQYPLTDDADDGAALIAGFMRQLEDGSTSLSTVYSTLSNEELAGISEIGQKMRLRGITLA